MVARQIFGSAPPLPVVEHPTQGRGITPEINRSTLMPEAFDDATEIARRHCVADRDLAEWFDDGRDF